MSLIESQAKVADFCDRHGVQTDPAYRLLDLVAEVGELATDANESTGYGSNPGEVAVKSDEIGDAFFSLLALSNELGIDAERAFDEALEKYERRIDETGSPGSSES